MKLGPHTLDATGFKQAAVLAAEHAPYRVPLYAAAAAQAIDLTEHLRSARLSKRNLNALREPAILLVSDDEGETTGPSGWSGIKHAKRWATSAIINAAAGEAAHYQMAVDAARCHKRLLLVETTVEHRDAWISALDPLPYGVITPPDTAKPRQRAA